MGQFQSTTFKLNPPTPGVTVTVDFQMLFLLGLNMPVEISTASAYVAPPLSTQRRSIQVMAHFDTGCSVTSIDMALASHLQLVQTGMGISTTANGSATNPNYAIDIAFINSSLKPIQNLQISSCRLPFNVTAALTNSKDSRNFGLLIGRDIMSRWHVTWNGPTSAVFITD